MNKHKKKLGKFARAKKYYKTNRRRVLIIAACVVLVLVGTYNIFHKRSQAMLKRDLDAVGVELDKISQRLDESLPPGAVVERKHWCYRASRKGGREPIYCTQRVYVNSENVSDEQSIADAATIKQILESSAIKFKQDTIGQRLDFNNEVTSTSLSFNFRKAVYYGNSFCYGTFMGYGSARAFIERPTAHNMYRFEIDCMGNGNFDRFVYPENKD